MNSAELEAAVRDGLVDTFAMMDDRQRRQTIEKLEEYQALRDILINAVRVLNESAARHIIDRHTAAFQYRPDLSAFTDLPAWVSWMQGQEVLLQAMYEELAGAELPALKLKYPTYFRPMQILDTAELRDLTVSEGIRIAKELKAGMDGALTPDDDHARRLEASRMRIKNRTVRG
jgi:hypothetical protein